MFREGKMALRAADLRGRLSRAKYNVTLFIRYMAKLTTFFLGKNSIKMPSFQ